jgi:hypothetical protein
MLTFVFGNCDQKRRYFSSFGRAFIDAYQTIKVEEKKGKTVVISGSRPFGTITAEDYVAYSRALCGDETTPAKLLSAFNYRDCLDKRLNKLDAFEYRKVLIAARCGTDEKKLYIDFDDVIYTRRTAARLKKFCADLKKFDLVLLCSDLRFFTRGCSAAVVVGGEYTALPCVSVIRVGIRAERKILLGETSTSSEAIEPAENIEIPQAYEGNDDLPSASEQNAEYAEMQAV